MPHDLDRFIAAQDRIYGDVLRELRAGRKSSHWMWFIFPQLKDLGRSDTSRFYGIATLDEARAYLDHAVLGARLRECTRLVNDHAGTPIDTILGHVDALKFRSSMTLFASARPGEDLFTGALAAFYEGQPDRATLALLAG
ncbi:DUF1810 domain-containing protein [Pseudoduganella umbonata]|uniref:DUF1810 domain-containing protein n=1 Tax=Pseudoduganella umbonata TaxID=864828 RepID=A0A4P8HR06_9BURK|nr:DUF1810 domain-containing protein [Pseudoduganella umbonata]MBB3224714.1 uncharacterized protein (DUF1810 family) [Pseudoduganella umbonata]QCP11032.1 DUF1810 domain-containing protein [Pseudoduganella umbonata]